jgi:hypothetical protein
MWIAFPCKRTESWHLVLAVSVALLQVCLFIVASEETVMVFWMRLFLFLPGA